jgi:hypothetical protein
LGTIPYPQVSTKVFPVTRHEVADELGHDTPFRKRRSTMEGNTAYA